MTKTNISSSTPPAATTLPLGHADDGQAPDASRGGSTARSRDATAPRNDRVAGLDSRKRLPAPTSRPRAVSVDDSERRPSARQQPSIRRAASAEEIVAGTTPAAASFSDDNHGSGPAMTRGQLQEAANTLLDLADVADDRGQPEISQHLDRQAFDLAKAAKRGPVSKEERLDKATWQTMAEGKDSAAGRLEEAGDLLGAASELDAAAAIHWDLLNHPAVADDAERNKTHNAAMIADASARRLRAAGQASADGGADARIPFEPTGLTFEPGEVENIGRLAMDDDLSASERATLEAKVAAARARREE